MGFVPEINYLVSCCILYCNSTVTVMIKIKVAYNYSNRQLFCLPKHNSASEMCVS